MNRLTSNRIATETMLNLHTSDLADKAAADLHVLAVAAVAAVKELSEPTRFHFWCKVANMEFMLDYGYDYACARAWECLQQGYADRQAAKRHLTDRPPPPQWPEASLDFGQKPPPPEEGNAQCH